MITEKNNMCPICITTMVVNGILWLVGAIGLTKLYTYLRKRYYAWSGKKCSVCKAREKEEIDANK